MTTTYHQHVLELEQCTPQWRENYIDHDGSLLRLNQAMDQGQSVMLVGPAMSGKSHIIRGVSAQLASISLNLQFNQEIPHPLPSNLAWLVIDDIDQYAHPEQIVSLSQHAPHIRWLFSGRTLPPLADLASRIQQCYSCHIQTPQKHQDLMDILRSIAMRYQYNIKDHFIRQSIHFLPWQPDLIIRHFLGYIQYCHRQKKPPTVSGMKVFYGLRSP